MKDYRKSNYGTVVSEAPLVKIKVFDSEGNWRKEEIKKIELSARHKLHLRDFRFSTPTSILIRENCIVVALQDIKAVITASTLTLIDAEQPVIEEFAAEFQEQLRVVRERKVVEEEYLPYEFVVLDAMLLKTFSAMESQLNSLLPSVTNTLNTLLDPRMFSVDQGQLHILLHLSKNLSEFQSLLLDLESTLNELMEVDEDMAEMYLTHKLLSGTERDPEETEEIENLLEAYSMQLEDLLSKTRQLKQLIERSESIILINLDSQRNVMLRLSLQLEMGTFAAAICGIIGVAFGMNLDSSLEENKYAFWVVTGFMYVTMGILWTRLLVFLGRNLEKASFAGLFKKGRRSKSTNTS
jgi:magnesium transporter